MTTDDARKIHRAMRDPDHWVIRLEYVDQSGKRTRRVISPVRWVGKGDVSALCFAREDVRRFARSRCSSVELIPAHSAIMPTPIEEL